MTERPSLRVVPVGLRDLHDLLIAQNRQVGGLPPDVITLLSDAQRIVCETWRTLARIADRAQLYSVNSDEDFEAFQNRSVWTEEALSSAESTLARVAAVRAAFWQRDFHRFPFIATTIRRAAQ